MMPFMYLRDKLAGRHRRKHLNYTSLYDIILGIWYYTVIPLLKTYRHLIVRHIYIMIYASGVFTGGGGLGVIPP